MMKQLFQQMEFLEGFLNDMDQKFIAQDPERKKLRLRLDVSKDKGTGSLNYVRALAMDKVADGSRLAAAKAIADTVAKEFAKEAKDLTKSPTLIKRTQDG